MEEQWSDELKALYAHDLREMWDPGVARHIWNQYHNQLDIYFDLVKGRGPLDVLDVGCAQATLAMLLAEKGHRVWAVDIRQPFLAYAAKRHEAGEIRFICGNVMELELNKRFDVIFANQILEHLVHPVEFIRRLGGWLEPGGWFIGTSPNGEYWKNDLPSFSELGEKEQYRHLQYTADADGHFFAYTQDELAEIARSAGLQVLEVRHFETPWISGHMKIRYLHGLLPYRWLRLLDRVWLRIPWLGVHMAHQCLILARKP